MKKHTLLAVLLAGALITPTGTMAQDTGGAEPPPQDVNQTQPPPPPTSGGEQPHPPEGQLPPPGESQFRQPPPPGQNGGPGQPPFGGRQFPGGNQQMTGPNQQRPQPFPPDDQRRQPGLFPNPQQQEGQNQGGEFGGEPGEDFQEFVDQRELQQVQRQITDLKKQAMRLLTKARKNTALANEAQEVQNFINELTNYAAKVKTGTREALQEFYDAELWQILNGFQARIEMPTEIARIEKDLVRLEKFLAAKTFSAEGVDISLVRSKIEEVRGAVSGAKSALVANDAEGAREYLQVVYEGTHPGEMYGVLQQLQNITRQLKTVKNAEVKQAILETLSPVYEAVASGDFREANMALNEINRELFSILGKVRSTRGVNTDLRNKMRALEQKLEGRIQQIESQESQNQPGAFVPYQSSQSGFGSLILSVKNFLGL